MELRHATSQLIWLHVLNLLEKGATADDAHDLFLATDELIRRLESQMPMPEHGIVPLSRDGFITLLYVLRAGADERMLET